MNDHEKLSAPLRGAEHYNQIESSAMCEKLWTLPSKYRIHRQTLKKAVDRGSTAFFREAPIRFGSTSTAKRS
jgi:hypothetical protein